MENLFEHHSDRDLVGVLERVLDALTEERLRLDAPEQRLQVALAVVRVASRAQVWAQQLIAGIEADEVAVQVHGTSTRTWLTDTALLTPREAARMLRAGHDLARFAQVARAASTGEVSAAQAEAITSVLADLPAEFDAEQLAQGEATMIEFAHTHNSRELRTLSQHLVEVLDPEIAEQTEAERLERDLREARARRSLGFHDDGHGSVLIRGSLPVADAEPLRKLIDSYAAQLKRGLEGLDPLHPVPTAAKRRADALVRLVERHQQRSLAPCLGGDRPRVTVTVSWETLLKQASETGTASHPDTGATETSATESSATESGATESGATETSATETSATESGATESGATQTSATQTSATESGATQTSATTHTVPGASAGRNTSAGLATPPRLGGGITGTGRQIAPSVLRGLLCDADILPIVLGGSSEILDVGREHRLVTPAIRAALNQRDQGCVFPGCDAAPETSHAHHITPWWSGGSTALHNLVLLCPHHHGIIEPGHHPNADRWRLTLRPDGISEIRPPRRVDPQQKPRVHARFLTGLRT